VYFLIIMNSLWYDRVHGLFNLL